MEIDVKRIAKLARLRIPDEQVKSYEKEMSDIVDMVKNLPPLESKGALIDVDNTMELREDTIQPSYPRDEMLKNVPQTAAGCIVVPKTV